MQEAAKVISDWGSEGYETASRIVGRDVAHGMLSTHIRHNVERMNPDATPWKINEITARVTQDVFPDELSREELDTLRAAANILNKHNRS